MYHSRFDPKSTPIAGSTFGCHGTTLLLGAGKVHRKDFATLGPSHKQAADPKVRAETMPLSTQMLILQAWRNDFYGGCL